MPSEDCPVWSKSLLCAQWKAKDPRFLHVDSKDSDQTGRMPRLIWVFAGRTCHFVGFVMRRLKFKVVAVALSVVKLRYSDDLNLHSLVDFSIFISWVGPFPNLVGLCTFSYGPRQANLVLIAYASSEGSGEPAHPRSLARTFAARSYKQWVKRNLQTESQIPGPSEWLGMPS